MNAAEQMISLRVCDILRNDIEQVISKNMPLISQSIARAAESKSTEILNEIHEAVSGYNPEEDNADFDTLEKIVCIFEKNNISCDGCHDF